MSINTGSRGLLPARMLNEFVYCPRLFYLEFVEGEFQDSADTIDGTARHRRVDVETGELQLPEALGSSADAIKIHARSVTLSGRESGLIARMDLVEGRGKKLYPVEYKKGEKPDLRDGAWPTDIIQVVAQAIILRENGYECDEGIIYYFGTKERVPIAITEERVKGTMDEIGKAWDVSDSSDMPPPLVDSPKCPACSLASICLPDEINSLTGQDKETQENEIRRLYPARDDALPVYIQEQGCSVSKKSEELEVKLNGKPIARSRLIEISQLSLFGNVQVTTQAIHELCKRNVTICYFSLGGWFNGITHGMSHKNVDLRRRQYAVAEDPAKSIIIARRFIEGKIRNCRTLLRRNSIRPETEAMTYLQMRAEEASRSKDPEDLLGIEGSAARVYFQHFKDMIKSESPEARFNFESRNRRPPTDPVNALLSYVYALLSKDLTVTLLATGFDPYLGFFHKPRYGRPGLALDLMEEFRPIIGDSVVISLINNQEINLNDFVIRGTSTGLTSNGRKKVINAYERRLDSLVTHPVFGYRISYRRILEVQSRLVSRWLSGEIREYPMFCTR